MSIICTTTKNTINNMKPEDKAKQLVDKFKNNLALICVDEIIEFGTKQGIREPMMYWSKVREQITKYK
jgi:hypothetical protein